MKFEGNAFLILASFFQAVLGKQQTHEHGMVPKVSLTQKGYIQFLRYVVDVPDITEYTFCIWVRSNNLTHNHPLLSYSKHEEERLIRAWISPLGTHLNLEILQVPVFAVPVHLVENEWYHICQSWSTFLAQWSLYLNGKAIANGHAQKLRNAIIPAKGDLVVGQEYTDFDKGLDDGIEGDISGFNLVLASAFPKTSKKNHLSKIHITPNNIFKREATRRVLLRPPNKVQIRRQIWDESLELFAQHKLVPSLPLEGVRKYPQEGNFLGKSDQYYIDKPLGLLLVELSNDCGYLRGAPLSGKGVLVSWTKTEVRVFGGAILKTVPPFCHGR
ncbi:C-reactive protein 1.1-like [Anthonomus grandis grandis]|uniref:C-reactive protein 1.1-like n=1 Tax=Anthonomus grandis grandis TaxID=2921223 RepID=UPI0021664465|nr:C-reactive protein 1.1-like [Anthonomus grandis grandis]